jgi:hypothetical protein
LNLLQPQCVDLNRILSKERQYHVTCDVKNTVYILSASAIGGVSDSEYAMTIAQLTVVMAGRVPAIHALARSAGDAGKGADARVKRA